MAKGDSGQMNQMGMGNPQASRLGMLAQIMNNRGQPGIAGGMMGGRSMGGDLGGQLGQKVGGPIGGMIGDYGGDLLQNYIQNQIAQRGGNYAANAVANTAGSIGQGGNFLKSMGGGAGLAGMGIGIGTDYLAGRMKEGKASGAISGAGKGAQYGAMFGPIGMGIGAAGGALVGAIKGNQNTTKGQREDLAKRYGYNNLGDFNNYLSSLGPQGEELRRIGEGVIGKKDRQAQAQWNQQVQQLLSGVGQQMQPRTGGMMGGWNPMMGMNPAIQNRMMAAQFSGGNGPNFGALPPGFNFGGGGFSTQMPGGMQAPMEGNTQPVGQPITQQGMQNFSSLAPRIARRQPVAQGY